MTEWKVVKLGDVITINPDSIQKDYSYDVIDYIDISAVGTGELRETTQYSLKEAPSRAKRLVKAGDTILSTVRPNRRSFLYLKNPKINQVVSTGFAVLRATSKIDSRFLYYLISNQQFTDYLVSQEQGAAYPAINVNSIKNANLSIPDLVTQRGIVNVLGAIDDKIELNLKINANLEKMVMTLFKHWFIDFEPFKEESFYESDLGLIPKGWEVTNLEGFCHLITDGAHASPKDYPNNKYIGTVKDMGMYSFDYSNCKSISDEDFEKLVAGKCQPHKGDVLLSKDGTMGKVLYIEETKTDMVLLSSIAILRPKFSPYYLYTYLRNPKTIEMIINGYASGSALTRLVLKSIKSIPIIKPSEEILDLFDEKVGHFIEQAMRNQKEIESLRELRDYLLPKLLSGDITLRQSDC